MDKEFLEISSNVAMAKNWFKIYENQLTKIRCQTKCPNFL